MDHRLIRSSYVRRFSMTINPLSAKKARTGTLLLSFLMIFTIVLAACGGSNTTAHKVNKNSSLTLLGNAGGDYPRNFNPYNPSVISGTPGLIYETLLYFNRLDGSVKPWLASSYERSSDATSITFHLRKGVVCQMVSHSPVMMWYLPSACSRNILQWISAASRLSSKP